MNWNVIITLGIYAAMWLAGDLLFFLSLRRHSKEMRALRIQLTRIRNGQYPSSIMPELTRDYLRRILAKYSHQDRKKTSHGPFIIDETELSNADEPSPRIKEALDRAASIYTGDIEKDTASLAEKFKRGESTEQS